jgi:hypothetical protein
MLQPIAKNAVNEYYYEIQSLLCNEYEAIALFIVRPIKVFCVDAN